MYPECDDHILIYPELANYSASNLWTAFEVNWTPVHALSWVYEAPHNLHLTIPTAQQSAYLIPPCSKISLYNINLLFRVWIETPLQAWLTIWKQIIFPVLYGTGSYITELSLQVKVWLLHTDWTIDYIATNDYWNAIYNGAKLRYWTDYNYSNLNWDWWNWWKSNTVITWSWMTTVEWDRIIVEYITNAVQEYLYLIIWTLTPTKIEERIYPIQISID